MSFDEMLKVGRLYGRESKMCNMIICFVLCAIYYVTFVDDRMMPNARWRWTNSCSSVPLTGRMSTFDDSATIPVHVNSCLSSLYHVLPGPLYDVAMSVSFILGPFSSFTLNTSTAGYLQSMFPFCCIDMSKPLELSASYKVIYSLDKLELFTISMLQFLNFAHVLCMGPVEAST